MTSVVTTGSLPMNPIWLLARAANFYIGVMEYDRKFCDRELYNGKVHSIHRSDEELQELKISVSPQPLQMTS